MGGDDEEAALPQTRSRATLICGGLTIFLCPLGSYLGLGAPDWFGARGESVPGIWSYTIPIGALLGVVPTAVAVGRHLRRLRVAGAEKSAEREWSVALGAGLAFVVSMIVVVVAFVFTALVQGVADWGRAQQRKTK